MSLRSGAFTRTAADTAALAASCECAQRVVAANPVQCTPDAQQVRALARALSARPLDDDLAAEFTRLAVLAKHVRAHGGVVTCPTFRGVLHGVAQRAALYTS